MAKHLAQALSAEGLTLFTIKDGATCSHQFALIAAAFGGGQTASKTLKKAGFLACAIRLPLHEVAGDMNGLRIGTPELVRWGITETHCAELARLIALALRSNTLENLASEVAHLRSEFSQLHYIHSV